MNFSLKYYRTRPFLFIILVLIASLSWLFELAGPHLNAFHIRLPSILSVIGLVLFVYDKWLWKWRGFRLLVNVKNISGRYKGRLKYIWNGKDTVKECVIEVHQRASAITVWLYTSGEDGPTTRSKSICENFIQEEGQCTLLFFYTNYGSDNRQLSSHEGVNILHVRRSESGKLVLEGIYFTDRIPQTRGEIKVKFASKKLKEKF